MSKKLHISIPLGSEVSDQINDAVRAGKITRKDEKAFWKAFDAYMDSFGQVTLVAEFDKGVTIRAGNGKDSMGHCNHSLHSLNQNDECSECKKGDPFEKEGTIRSVGGWPGGWHSEKFTNGKWVRIKGKRR